MKSKCSTDTIPEVRLAVEKNRCLRHGPVAPALSNPQTVVDFLVKHYSCQPQERVLAVGFDSRNTVLGVLEVSVGGIDGAVADPRVLFTGLLLMGASAFILAHNHPSGDPTPSTADVQLTRQLKTGAESLGIRMLDHLVIGRTGNFQSFQASGMMP